DPGMGDGVDENVVEALRLLAAGRPGEAREVAGRAGGGRLRAALARYLDARHDGRVYDDPAAFQEFIGGGGNRALYTVLVPRLTAAYREFRVVTVLDVGCGDGRAVLPAAAALGTGAPALDLVEPSAALLRAACTTADELGLDVRAHGTTVQELLADGGGRWDLVQSTFALHALEPARRSEVLRGLRDVADALLVADFDVPAFLAEADGGPEHLRYLAARYELGVAEYEGDLVPDGFLMPVLVGQVEPGRVRSTWEEPASAWASRLAAAGWRNVRVEPLVGYWWAPAFVVTATAGRTRRGSGRSGNGAGGPADGAGGPADGGATPG
ncbi:MAG TPA: class I SAM-dependent methyltransferase, partial [Pseudonocardiaceae bacterium]